MPPVSPLPYLKLNQPRAHRKQEHFCSDCSCWLCTSALMVLGHSCGLFLVDSFSNWFTVWSYDSEDLIAAIHVLCVEWQTFLFRRSQWRGSATIPAALGAAGRIYLAVISYCYSSSVCLRAHSQMSNKARV